MVSCTESADQTPPELMSILLPGCAPVLSFPTGTVFVELPPVYSTEMAYGTPADIKNWLGVKSNVTRVNVGNTVSVAALTPADTANGDPVGMAVEPGVPVTA